jgi:hypothetical protein
MRARMNRRLFAFLAFVVAALCARAANACSCDQPPPPPERAAAVSAVFEGYVLDTTLDAQHVQLVVRYQVLRAWKGVHADTVVTVTTGSNGAACGIDATLHTSYLIYANEFQGQLLAELCFGSHRSDQDMGDFAALGAPAEVGTVAPGSLSAGSPTSGNGGCTVAGAGGSSPLSLLAATALLRLTVRRHRTLALRR